MAKAGIGVNSAMCVFNLIPVPPLDGGRIVTGLLPMPLARRMRQHRALWRVHFHRPDPADAVWLADRFPGNRHALLQSIWHLLVLPLQPPFS
jgi:hypothetical protein